MKLPVYTPVQDELVISGSYPPVSSVVGLYLQEEMCPRMTISFLSTFLV